MCATLDRSDDRAATHPLPINCTLKTTKHMEQSLYATCISIRGVAKIVCKCIHPDKTINARNNTS